MDEIDQALATLQSKIAELRTPRYVIPDDVVCAISGAQLAIHNLKLSRSPYSLRDLLMSVAEARAATDGNRFFHACAIEAFAAAEDILAVYEPLTPVELPPGALVRLKAQDIAQSMGRVYAGWLLVDCRGGQAVYVRFMESLALTYRVYNDALSESLRASKASPEGVLALSAAIRSAVGRVNEKRQERRKREGVELDPR